MRALAWGALSSLEDMLEACLVVAFEMVSAGWSLNGTEREGRWVGTGVVGMNIPQRHETLNSRWDQKHILGPGRRG